MSLDMDQFREMCEDFMFNQKLPASLLTQQSRFELDGSSDETEIPQTVIGQGDTLISPLHNAMIAATIANGGVVNDHHGVVIKLGRLMKEQYGPAMQVFEGIKKALDPNGIMNPFKLGL